MHLVACHDITLRLLSLYRKRAEIHIELQGFQSRLRLQRHFDHLCLTVGIGREPGYARALRTLRQVILLVAGHACHGKTLHEEGAAAPVLVNHIVDSARIVACEQPYVPHILPDEQLLGNTHNLVAPVVVKYNHIVEQRTVEQRLVLLQPRADKPFLPVEIKFFVCLGHT